MGHTLVDVKSLKSLEDLAIQLTSAIYSLMTLHNYQVRAIEIGIMQEDMNERANTIAWDLKRLMKHYQIQLDATLELLPPEFDPKKHIKKMIRAQRKEAKERAKEESCVT